MTRPALSSRLARLERAAPPRVCPACGAGGTVIEFAPLELRSNADERIEPDALVPCPECGTMPLRFPPLSFGCSLGHGDATCR